TSQEINSDHFELLRSFNGNDYEVAANVRAAGNNGKAYQYKDKVTVPGNVVYYKLKQVDKDGQFSFSNIIKLNVTKGKMSLQLFPNPVINDFTATLSVDKSASATLLIRNVTGQTVYSKTVNLVKGNNSLVITDASLRTGMYYVSIVNDEINYSSKLQKQ
ncbi:MAG: T9SS type A sorting domain-containing protein, partial [Ferruginibacter sp.]